MVAASAFMAGVASASTEPPGDSSAPAPGVATLSDEELAALYEAAKAEGSVVLYTAANEVQVAPLIEGFQSRWPDIEVEWSRTSTPEMIQRFNAEADAGAVSTDVIHAPDFTFLRDAVDRDLLLPLTESPIPADFPAEWVLDDGALAVQTVTLSGLAYNSSLIDEADAPQTWEDLLDPKWKGQILALDPNLAGGAIREFWDFVERALGPEYLEGIAAQDLIWYDSAVPAAQAHAAGEAPIFIPAFPSLTSQMQANGAPVVQVEQSTATGVIFGALPVAGAEHPNAAALLVYDMYTAESQDAFANASGQVSPWGGGMSQAPEDFFFPESASANSEERIVEINELLGL